MSTKSHACTDALGNPSGFHLTAGQVSDLAGAHHWLPSLDAGALLADKAYDADERVLKVLEASGTVAVNPPKCNRRVQHEYDRDLYQARHLIENCFQKLKPFRAIATRYDKLARNFLAGVHLASTCILWPTSPPTRVLKWLLAMAAKGISQDEGLAMGMLHCLTWQLFPNRLDFVLWPA